MKAIPNSIKVWHDFEISYIKNVIKNSTSWKSISYELDFTANQLFIPTNAFFDALPKLQAIDFQFVQI